MKRELNKGFKRFDGKWSECKMEKILDRHWIRYLSFAFLVIGVASACQMSASKAPTAFSFPTPDATGTAIYWIVATSLAPSQAPAGAVTPSATKVSAPSSTPIPVVTATSAAIATSAATATLAPTATPPPSATSAPLYRSVGKIAATFFQTPPNIDGNLSKWGLFQYPVDYVVYGKADWVDAQDLSAKVMVGWDYNNLYLGVHVIDSRYVQNSSGEYLYLGDSLEVQLDTNLQADFYVNSLSPDDFQLGIMPGSPNPGDDPEAYLWLPRTIRGLRPKVEIAAQAVDGGYDVEVAIPWKVFEVTPAAGEHFGFVFSVSDNDKRTEDLQQSMVSSASTRRLTDPTTWGDLLLKEP
jgi:hypothetical protein